MAILDTIELATPESAIAPLRLYPEYTLPDYSTVAGSPTVEFGQPEEQSYYGKTYTDRWQMNDEAGTNYRVVRCYSARPISDTWVVKDTALGTQPEGLNTDVARKLMAMGFNVLIKGPEIGSSLAQSHSAFNTHLILDALQSLGMVDASAIAIEGYSRGAMLGFGTISYAENFGRQVIYANLTDPCIAVPVGFNTETLKKAVKLPADLGLLALAIVAVGKSPRRGKHLCKTVDLSLSGLAQFVNTGLPLLDGEAGKMADTTPTDLKATVAFFGQSGFNDQETFQAILASRPYVRIVRPDGGHGKAIDKRIIGNIAVRFGRLGEQLHEGRALNELDYQKIIFGVLKAKAA